MNIRKSTLPAHALSRQYAELGAFTDCYHVDMARRVSLQDYIEAFYTTAVFKIEKSILAMVTGRSPKNTMITKLISGHTDQFLIWTVEEQQPEQILLCDVSRRTRSWLMVTPIHGTDAITTRLYFGSVVLPNTQSKSGQPSFGPVFHLLSGFHRIYSRALLRSAAGKLSKKIQ